MYSVNVKTNERFFFSMFSIPFFSLWIFLLPSFGKVSPVGDHVSREVTVTRPVSQRSGEWFSKHILQVVGVVCSHPAGVGFGDTAHSVWLRKDVGIRFSCSVEAKRKENKSWDENKQTLGTRTERGTLLPPVVSHSGKPEQMIFLKTVITK